VKNILIVGANSYIGTSLENWLAKHPDKYAVNTISIRQECWREKDFSNYDVVFHVAGIAHIKETKGNADAYYKVNRDLAYETAKKAKSEGVKQFIFISSMSVYGIKGGVIDSNTPLNPYNHYGKSKLQAEEMIKTLMDDSFLVAILRPPMIYGKGCKGNYPVLAKVAVNLPIFPDVDNKRSMIYIDNFSEFVKHIIDNYGKGLYFPQNVEYVNTSKMVKLIADAHGRKIRLTKIFNPIIRLLGLKFTLISKVFGDLVYDKSMSKYKGNYHNYDFELSIKETEI